jgi:tRNA pseudouridine38-40 synthase
VFVYICFMPRYFLEVAYHGARFSGFQVQENAHSVQAEVEQAFAVLQRSRVVMSGSSRTDAGVHALQNFFHFDYDGVINPQFLYKINAILPPDVVVKGIYPVADEAHCRFDALSRTYKYYIYQSKNPFLNDRAYYFPYKLDEGLLHEAAKILFDYEDFTSFSKRNTQVKTFNCRIMESCWLREGDCLVYQVRANRFLRGMVRGLVGTMLKIGRGKLELAAFGQVIAAKDCTLADFSAPAKGLFLVRVEYPANTNIN